MRQAREAVQLPEHLAKEILKDTTRKCASADKLCRNIPSYHDVVKVVCPMVYCCSWLLHTRLQHQRTPSRSP